jgi:hypothetical protein
MPAGVCIAGAIMLTGCVSGQFSYSPPGPLDAPLLSKTVDRARADTWRFLIPQLARTFFVINNLDQSSGLVNVSYSGDPERFVDCGHIVSRVKNLQGERVYDFPASRARQTYEVRTESGAYGLVERAMSLEGRVNLVLEELSPTRTRLTANIRYILARHVRIHSGGSVQDYSESIYFGSTDRSSFPTSSHGKPTVCQSTGALEKELLQLMTQGAVSTLPN